MKKKSDEFGPVLCQLRQQRNLTQEQLSELVGTSSSFISMLESSHKYPNLEMLFKLAHALGIPAGRFLDEMDKRLEESR
ncbi:helix-turn-helix domain-containing protein [Mailhella sp.]